MASEKSGQIEHIETAKMIEKKTEKKYPRIEAVLSSLDGKRTESTTD